MTRPFFDSNILLYTIEATDLRRERAGALIAGGGVISVQCLNEFAAVARGKLGLDWPTIASMREQLVDLFEVVSLTLDMHIRGMGLAERYRFSIYDAMIVSAALVCGCDTLWSEDMHDGLVVEERLTIRNPFAD